MACCVIVACSSNNYNPTAYSFDYSSDLTRNNAIHTVMIAPINFDKPSRYFINKNASSIDTQVKRYLEQHGYTIRSSRNFDNRWKKITREYGNMYDDSRGQHTSAFKPALTETMDYLFASDPKLDAIIFTDLILSPVHYTQGSSKSAQWHGVTRKLKVQGLGSGASEDFDWSKAVDGISLASYVFNREQKLVLHSVGGIQIAQALDLQNNQARFKRRRDILSNDNEIQEAIALALHPLVPMKNYPSNSLP